MPILCCWGRSLRRLPTPPDGLSILKTQEPQAVFHPFEGGPGERNSALGLARDGPVAGRPAARLGIRAGLGRPATHPTHNKTLSRICGDISPRDSRSSCQEFKQRPAQKQGYGENINPKRISQRAARHRQPPLPSPAGALPLAEPGRTVASTERFLGPTLVPYCMD